MRWSDQNWRHYFCRSVSCRLQKLNAMTFVTCFGDLSLHRFPTAATSLSGLWINTHEPAILRSSLVHLLLLSDHPFADVSSFDSCNCIFFQANAIPSFPTPFQIADKRFKYSRVWQGDKVWQWNYHHIISFKTGFAKYSFFLMVQTFLYTHGLTLCFAHVWIDCFQTWSKIWS